MVRIRDTSESLRRHFGGCTIFTTAGDVHVASRTYRRLEGCVEVPCCVFEAAGVDYRKAFGYLNERRVSDV